MDGREFVPGYLKLSGQAKLKQRVEQALEVLSECRVCARECYTDRTKEAGGSCGVGRYAIVSSYAPHFGEERPLVGRHGSGTIFFAHCNLGCVFCQNYDISHHGQGEAVGPEVLARIMLALQRMGCHNINLVTPSHVVPQVLEALPFAVADGLCIPLVYNSGGYDSVETLELLDGIIDIYMPDFKYFSSEVAARLSNAPDYPEVAKRAVREMHRQVGDLQLDASGIARRGLLVRHLVLPEDQAGSRDVANFIAEKISKNTYVNVMDQYRPCFMAHKIPSLTRRISAGEYQWAVKAFLQAGITRLDAR